MLFCRAEIASAANKLRRETKSFAQAFSNKGTALDPPETLSLDSAGTLSQTLQRDAVPLNPNFVAARKLAHSVQTAQSAFGG